MIAVPGTVAPEPPVLPATRPAERLVQLVVVVVAALAAIAAVFAFLRPDAFVAASHAADAAFNLEVYGERTPPSAYAYEGVVHAQLISALVLAQAALAIALAWRAPHRADARALALFMAALAAAEGHFAYPAQAVGLGTTFSNRAAFVAALAAMAAFLQFAARFPVALTRDDVLARPGKPAPGALRRRVWPALLSPAVVWCAATLLALPIVASDRLGIGTPLLFLVLLPWTIVQGVRMLRVGYRVAPAPLRRRALWVAQGFAGGLAWLMVSAIAAPVVAASLHDPAAAELLRAFPFHSFVTPIFTGCLALAVFYGGGLDPALTIRRTAVYGVLGLGAVFLFAGIEGLVGNMLTQRLGLSATGATWFSGGAAGLICGKLRGKAAELGARVLGPLLPERTLAELPADDAVVVVVDPCDEEGDPDPTVRLAALHALAKRTVRAHGGSIDFVLGDAVVLTFATPNGAATAIAALRAAWPADGGALRVGVQRGRVVRVPEGGIVSTALAQADRLRRQALPGEVRDGSDPLGGDRRSTS